MCNGVADCQDSILAPLGGPTDEEGCRSWSSWGHWSPCSASCGPGFISRRRHCPPGEPLYHCAGEAIQKQQCFNTTCPGKTGLHKNTPLKVCCWRSLNCLWILQWMASGCLGWIGQTVPAVAESRSGTETVSLLVMVEETVHSSLDCPISPWKLVRVCCSCCLWKYKFTFEKKTWLLILYIFRQSNVLMWVVPTPAVLLGC